MADTKSNGPGQGGEILVHLNSVAAILAGVLLFIAGGLAGYGWFALRGQHPMASPQSMAEKDTDSFGATEPSVKGPWGELVIREIELEQPEEYALYHTTNEVEQWTFEA